MINNFIIRFRFLIQSWGSWRNTYIKKNIPCWIIDKNENEKNRSNKERNRSSEKNKLPKDKSNKSIYILGNSMMKHLEGWKLKKSIDKTHVFLGQR